MIIIADIKAVFLDIDGVLNNFNKDKKIRSKSRCGNLLGIDKDKVQKLARIVNQTDAEIILTSTWKMGWEPHRKYYYAPVVNGYNYHAKYLDTHLQKKGNLTIKDKTRESDLIDRGMGIRMYLRAHPEIRYWVVLDDEIFPDFKERGIFPHLVKTDSLIGLTDADADAAIKILNNQTQGPYYATPADIVLIKTAGPAVII